MALTWLRERGLDAPEVLLDATGGRPQEAWAWAQDGVKATAWQELPRRLARAEFAALLEWPLPRAIDALQGASIGFD